MLLTLLLLRLDNDRPLTSVDGCYWTSADADGMSVDADVKVSTSTHLCTGPEHYRDVLIVNSSTTRVDSAQILTIHGCLY